jgi:hypothetical protein
VNYDDEMVWFKPDELRAYVCDVCAGAFFVPKGSTPKMCCWCGARLVFDKEEIPFALPAEEEE